MIKDNFFLRQPSIGKAGQPDRYYFLQTFYNSNYKDHYEISLIIGNPAKPHRTMFPKKVKNKIWVRIKYYGRLAYLSESV